MATASMPGSWSNHIFLRYHITLLLILCASPSLLILRRAKEARVEIHGGALMRWRILCCLCVGSDLLHVKWRIVPGAVLANFKIVMEEVSLAPISIPQVREAGG